MCLLALFFRVAEDAAVVVGANREESYARGGEPPRLVEGPTRFVAGLDLTAGGTWLGVNEHGLLVALTNRPKSRVPARPRSRGLLARDLLGCPSAGAAVDLATRELGRDLYAGCNVLCADADRAVVVQASDWLRVRPLPPGLHLLTNADVNDGSDRRLARASDWLRQWHYPAAQACIRALRQLCSCTERDGLDVCFRDADRGTVSSSLIALRKELSRSLYLHAQGPPDRTPYADCSSLLKQLVRASQGDAVAGP